MEAKLAQGGPGRARPCAPTYVSTHERPPGRQRKLVHKKARWNRTPEPRFLSSNNDFVDNCDFPVFLFQTLLSFRVAVLMALNPLGWQPLASVLKASAYLDYLRQGAW